MTPGPQGARPARPGDVRRGGGVPVPPPADPRRGVRGDAEGDAGGAPRAVRRMARAAWPASGCSEYEEIVALPPGAGVPVPARSWARSTRRRGTWAAARPNTCPRRPPGRRPVATSSRRRGLLARASALLADDDPERLRLQPTLGRAMFEAGEIEAAGELLRRAAEEAEREGDRSTAAWARVNAMVVGAAIGVTSVTEVIEQARATAEMFEELGDEGGLASAYGVMGQYQFFGGSCADAAATLEEARRRAEAAGRTAQAFDATWWIAAALFFGPTPASEMRGDSSWRRRPAPGDAVGGGGVPPRRTAGSRRSRAGSTRRGRASGRGRRSNGSWAERSGWRRSPGTTSGRSRWRPAGTPRRWRPAERGSRRRRRWGTGGTRPRSPAYWRTRC